MTRRRFVAVALALLLTVPLAVQVGLAAENVHDGSATPDSANETAKVKHTFSYRVDNVSNDGSSDELFVTFPDEVTSEDLSSFSGNVTDAETGASVSISSSPSIVDGPDGDGVQDTVAIGIQPEGERATIDLVVNVTGYVTWPAVDSDRNFPVNASVTDSGRANVELVTFATVTVQDESTADSTGTDTPTPTATPSDSTGGTATDAPDGTDTPDDRTGESPTPSGTDAPAGTDDATGTETTTPADGPSPGDTATPTDDESGTSGDGPGFGPIVALGALLLTAALVVGRR